MSDQPAFDALAPDYDRDFTAHPSARYLRARVHTRLAQHFPAGSHVLELGCGTGEDALALAARGVYVTATDVSPAMLAQTRTKTAGTPLVTCAPLDLRNLPGGFSGPFDGAFANFGPLNCLDEWRTLAGWLAKRIRPGGAALFAVMSPLCLWEIGWHGLHGDLRTATRRGRATTVFQPDAGPPIPIRYPTIKRLSDDFGPAFRRTHVEPLGLVLPPSDVYGVIEARPRLLRRLIRLEDRLSRIAQLARFADHYWIEFVRLPST
ncbi:MAG: methyltransferase domain-containing protein [Chloroflexi bacterium]|nr:methyltransferase domain-containing protein [Chloroflexota bacterium]